MPSREDSDVEDVLDSVWHYCLLGHPRDKDTPSCVRDTAGISEGRPSCPRCRTWWMLTLGMPIYDT